MSGRAEGGERACDSSARKVATSSPAMMSQNLAVLGGVTTPSSAAVEVSCSLDAAVLDPAPVETESTTAFSSCAATGSVAGATWTAAAVVGTGVSSVFMAR